MDTDSFGWGMVEFYRSVERKSKQRAKEIDAQIIADAMANDYSDYYKKPVLVVNNYRSAIDWRDYPAMK